MSYLVYLTLLPPIIIGILFVSWILLPSKNTNLMLILSLGIPLGLGIISCFYFLWSYILNPAFPGFICFELALIAALGFLNWRQRAHITEFLSSTFKNRNKLEWIFGVLFLAIAIIGIATFINYTNVNPHGRYDAWAIWNLRARMIARGADQWKSIFIPQVFHADYPLLLPLSIAHSWVLAGTESQRIPPAIAGLFTFATSGILVGSLFSLKRRSMGWLAGIILLSTPWVIYFGSLQFADLPLASLILAASSSLCMALIDQNKSTSWMILAGLSAGLAAWTKNEGQLFLLVFLVVVCGLIILKFKNQRTIGRLALSLGIGLILPVVAILIFKFSLAPANDVIDTGNLSPAIASLISAARYGEVINALNNYPKGFGGWIVPIPLVLLVFALIIQPQLIRERSNLALILIFLLIMQWTGYFLIYVITPHQLQVHINQSYDRLLMHLYPTFLLLFFLILRPIEDIFSTNKRMD
ncbi:MAG TPA: hypothetical protein VF338_04495 [Leptolinea sp.]